MFKIFSLSFFHAGDALFKTDRLVSRLGSSKANQSCDHGCGVANENVPFLVRWPAMWGREERLSRWPAKDIGVNADLVVCPASIDVV